MEEVKRVQELRIDESSRRRLIENQDTILEFTGKMQELQNEINCLNDSRDFQDAESVRSGHSHVASQPVSFPLHPGPGGILSRSLGMPSRKDGHACYFGKRFCRSSCVFYSTLSAGIESMEFRYIRTDSLINGREEWEWNTSSRSEMPVWTVSQKFSHPSEGDSSNNYGADQQRLQISYAVDQRSGDGWVSGWFKIFVICKRSSNARFWDAGREDCFSTEQNHP